MDSMLLTYCLVLLHLLVYSIALWLTRRPILTVFHLVLGSQFFTFVVRPLVATLHGGYTLYPTLEGWSAYNRGLILQLLFSVFYVVGYLVLFRTLLGSPLDSSPTIVRGYWVSLGLGVTSVLAIHFLSGGDWLPGARSVTLTSVTPLGKLLFPLAVIPLSVSLVLGFLALRRLGLQVLIVVGCMAALVLLVLLYQRGFVLLAMILTAFFRERERGIGYGRALVMVLVLLVLLAGLRPLSQALSGSAAKESDGTPVSFERIESLVLGPNFDNADVWPVAIAAVEERGYLLGRTFVAIPARFLTPSFRREVGLYTAVDYLNEYYWREYYWISNFGFNVRLPQELYLNFGPPVMIVGFVPGALTCVIDRWLWRRKFVHTTYVYFIAAAFASGGFMGELGGALQWGLTYIGLGILIGVACRLKFRR